MFFSEEKKRLLLLHRSHDPGHGRDLSAGTGRKSLLLLSSEKKNLPALSYCHFADLLLSLFLFESRA
jgi:hypothetical protein